MSKLPPAAWSVFSSTMSSVMKLKAPAVAKSPYSTWYGPFQPRRLDRLRDEEVQVGVSLPVGVAPQVHGQPVDEQRDIGAVVGVEAPQEVLLGLSSSLVLPEDEAGDQAQHVGRPTLRAQLEVALGNEHVGRRGDRRRRGHHDGRQRGLGLGRRCRRWFGRRRFLGAGPDERASQHDHHHDQEDSAR